MAQYRNFYRFKFRFSPPKAVQILISPSRMLAVNYVGALEKFGTVKFEPSYSGLRWSTSNDFDRVPVELLASSSRALEMIWS